MKKLSAWSVALITWVVSLAAMLVFDYLLTLAYYYIGKVSFLAGALEFIGEILDLGLTALVAAVVATAIWGFGLKLIRKIYGEKIPYEKSPVDRINDMFVLVFLAVLVFVGYHFFVNIGDAIAFYTENVTGLGKLLMFWKAIKEVFLYVRSEYILIYKIGFNSFILTVIDLFAAHGVTTESEES